MPEVSFAECSSEHVPAVQDFFARMYRPDYVLATDEALLRWQFGGLNAAGGQYHIKLALVDRTLAACLGYIPVEVSVGGRTLRGAWTANWIVDPAQRRMALGPLLMGELIRQHDVTLVVGASAAARQMLPRLGFTPLGELRRHVCVLDPVATAALTGSGHARWPMPRAGGNGGRVAEQIERVERFGSAVERLWDSVWGAHGAGTRRSTAFLNWRYADHPRFRYRLFEAVRNERVSGFAAYRVEDVPSMPIRIGRVVELVSAAGAEDGLLRALLDDARSQNVALMDLFCSSARVAPALQRNGWVPETEAPAEIPILFQPPVPGRRGIPFLGHLRKIDACDDIDRWYVTKGDGDQDRPN
jgi:hypothetical protein